MTPPQDGAPAPGTLREYAVIADGERGAVVGQHGEIVWMCWPRWHDPALLAALIGGAGHYSVAPVDPHVWGGRYEPGSLIWRARWVTNDATVECRDALAMPATRERAVLLRRIMACAGAARVRCVLAPAAAYGTRAPRRIRRDGETWILDLDTCRMRWWGAAGGHVIDGLHGALRVDLEVPPGEHRDLVLVVEEPNAAGAMPDAGRAWADTESAWRGRVPDLSSSAAPRDARHACAVMVGLTSTAGGMVAAATTSLPERYRRATSYDYRYAWVRDQCYAGIAALRAGVDEISTAATSFVSSRLLCDGPGLAPAYTVDGGRVPEERRLQLPGYPGGHDIVGNRVTEQFQLDAVGEALLLLARAAQADRLDADGWRALQTAAGVIDRRWGEPEAGIWELEARRWTHSRLACVAGLRAAAEAARVSSDASRWSRLADAILAGVTRSGARQDGAWQRAPDDARVDAALLMAAVRGAVGADDRRSRATLAAVTRDLTDDGYVYRFRHADKPLGEAEGAFLLCGFMIALDHHAAGSPVEAFRYFERTRSSCGPPGLFSEEYDVVQRQMRGNLPQAFVHALMLEAATALGRPPGGGDGAAARLTSR